MERGTLCVCVCVCLSPAWQQCWSPPRWLTGSGRELLPGINIIYIYFFFSPSSQVWLMEGEGEASAGDGGQPTCCQRSPLVP